MHFSLAPAHNWTRLSLSRVDNCYLWCVPNTPLIYVQDILGDKVEKVLVSDRIVDSPCCLVTGE
jgi:hypothetical protein